MKKIFDEIWNANPGRDLSNLGRRFIKAQEELGEAAGAFLAITSEENYKNKTWDDVREELVDSMIIIIDLLYTEFPDNVPNKKEIERRFIEVFDKKMAKWERQIRDRKDTTLTEKQ